MSDPLATFQPELVRLGWALIHLLWQGLAVAVALELALALAGHARARLRYFLCGVALVALPVCFALTYGRSYEPPAPMPAPMPALSVAPVGAGPQEDAPVADIPPGISSGGDTAPAPGEQAPRASFFRDGNELMPYVAWIWLASVVILGLRKAGGLAVLWRLRRQGVAEPDDAMMELFRRACGRLGIDPRRVCLRISRLARVPMTMGWVSPIVLFPAALASGLGTGEIELILAHELAHVRRWDYLVNLLQAVVETLFFYHPVTWWISRRMRQERENCCDDLVTRGPEEKLAYARTLLRLEELRAPGAALVTAATGGVLRRRIERLVGEPASGWAGGISVALVLLLVLGAGAAVSVAKGQSPVHVVANPAGIVVSETKELDGDVGRLYHAMVYQQTSAEAPKDVSWQFIADMSNNTFPVTAATVALPAGSAWATNPVTVVDPKLLVGAHYLFAQGFKSEAELLANFPYGTYAFNIQPAAPAGGYAAPVAFSGTVAYPPWAPVITNKTWDAGALVLDPASAVINYTNYPGATLTWEIVIPGDHYIMSAGGGGTAVGSLDLTGLLSYGQTYVAQLRFINRDKSSTVSQASAPKDYGYSTMMAQIVEFTIKTPAGHASATAPSSAPSPIPGQLTSSNMEMAILRDDLAGAQTLLDEKTEVAPEEFAEALGGERNGIVKLFWQHGYRFCSSLTYAISQGAGADAVEKKLREGSPVDPPEDKNISPLAVATVNGNLPVINILLTHGADPNSKSGRYIPGRNFSPLQEAISTRRPDVLALLLNHGAPTETENVWTAVMNCDPEIPGAKAFRPTNLSTVQILADHGALERVPQDMRSGILGFACLRDRDPDVVRLLLAHGFSPEDRDPFRKDSVLQRVRDACEGKDNWPPDAAYKRVLDVLEAVDKTTASQVAPQNVSVVAGGQAITAAEAKAKGIAAVVNGKPIYWADIPQMRDNPIEPVLRSKYRGNELEEKLAEARLGYREQAIMRELEIQDAEASGYEVPQKELDDRVDFGVKGFHGDKATFVQNLEENGLTLEKFNQRDRDDLMYAHELNLKVIAPSYHLVKSASGQMTEAEDVEKRTKLENDLIASLGAKASIQRFDDKLGIAAMVDGHVITKVELEQQWKATEDNLRANYAGDELKAKLAELHKTILQALVDRRLIIEDFKKQGGFIPKSYIDERINDIIKDQYGGDRDSFLKTLAQRGIAEENYRREIEDNAIVGYSRSKFVAGKVWDYYQAHVDQFPQDERVSVTVLEIVGKQEVAPGRTGNFAAENSPEADEARRDWQQLRAGADASAFPPLPDGFDRRYIGKPIWVTGQDPEDPYAGVPGWWPFKWSDIEKMKPGETSNIVVTDYAYSHGDAPNVNRHAYWMLRVNARRPASVATTPELVKQKEALLDAQAKRIQEAWLSPLRAKAKVQIFDTTLALDPWATEPARAMAVQAAPDATDAPVLPHPAAPAPTAALPREFVRIEARVVQISEEDYQGHRAGIDAAVGAGDVRPLVQLKSCSILSEPAVAMKSGERGVVEAVREFPFPTGYVRDASGTLTPTEFEKRDLGVRFPLTATIAGDTICVSGKLSLSTFRGWTQSGLKTFSPGIDTQEAYFYDEFSSGQTRGIATAGAEVLEPFLPPTASTTVSPKLVRTFLFLTAKALTKAELYGG